MEEVRGRRGVMRFDGEKSIVEAKSDSLKLKGDFTYALWVRQNAIEKSANCVLFQGPFYQFGTSAYTNLIFVAYSQDAAGDNMNMSWPVDRNILGTDGSHLTVVVAYPRIHRPLFRLHRPGRGHGLQPGVVGGGRQGSGHGRAAYRNTPSRHPDRAVLV